MTMEMFVGIFVVGGIVLTGLISIMSGAFIAGKHSNRIANLEARQADAEKEVKEARMEAAKASAQLAGFAATLSALSNTVHDGFEEVKAALRALGQPRARQRVGGGE